jgi:hypothetical protein
MQRWKQLIEARRNRWEPIWKPILRTRVATFGTRARTYYQNQVRQHVAWQQLKHGHLDQSKVMK